MASRHRKGVSGSLPLDPTDGVKDVQIVVKMTTKEAAAATTLARRRNISRSELIRQLLAREDNADHAAFLKEWVEAQENAPKP